MCKMWGSVLAVLDVVFEEADVGSMGLLGGFGQTQLLCHALLPCHRCQTVNTTRIAFVATNISIINTQNHVQGLGV